MNRKNFCMSSLTQMINIVDDFVRAYGQVVTKLSEETTDLKFVHMAQTTDEIGLHHEDALCNVLNILNRHILVGLTCC